MSTIWAFDSIGNKHTLYQDCENIVMKRLYERLYEKIV